MTNRQISRDEQRTDEERNNPAGAVAGESLANPQVDNGLSPHDDTLPKKKQRQAILGQTLTDIG